LIESQSQLADPVQTRLSVIQMSVDPHQATSIVMSQAEAVVPAALVRAKEKADDRAPEERGETDVVVRGAVESVLLGMEDLRRHKKSLMRRWRITGEPRRMVLKTFRRQRILT